MTQSEEPLFAQKEGISDNTEIKLLRSLAEILNERQIVVERKRPPQPPASSSTTSNKQHQQQSRVNSGKETLTSYTSHAAAYENDDEDIVVVDGGDSDFDLERECLDEESSAAVVSNAAVGDDHDDDDDIEYGPVVQSSSSNRRTTNKSDYEDEEEEINGVKSSASSMMMGRVSDETESTADISQLRLEIQLLDKFKTFYLSDYNLEESKYHKYFERVFVLIVNKRICNKNWTQNNSLSSKNVYSVLYCLRILLRSVHFQRKFLSIDDSFRSILKLLDRYVQMFSSLPNQVLVYAHILDQLLNILYKIFCSEILQADIEALRGNSGGQSRQSSQTSKSSSQTNWVKRLSKLAFAYNMHINLMQLIENSHEMCLVQASLNLLVQLSTIDLENRSVLAANLDISSQLLIILQECDEDSQRQAAKLLCLLCIEDEIKSEVIRMDGIQVLLSLLHSQTNLEIVWNVIWTLVQLCSSDENKREVRQMGGIPLILSIISDKSLDSDAESSSSSHSTADDSYERRLKARLQVQAACCALVGELALNETNSYQIANTNGVYLISSKLLVPANLSLGSSSGNGLNESQNSSKNGGDAAAGDSSSPSSVRSRDVERLHSNAWRTLRLLFSTERHRPLIKKLIPTSLFEPFVDIGNYKKDLKLYQPLVESFYKLTTDEMNIMRQQIQSSNHSQAPKNIINDYEVYEIIGSGAFGCVHKVRRRNTSNFLAMKEINTSVSSLKGQLEMVNEVTIIRNNLKHPNVVRYLKTFKENDRLYIVMELIDGTPLSQHLRKLKEKGEPWSEERLWHIFMQIVLALRYLHKEKQIVHRDLTSNNIMLSESDKVTITDFGLAKILENDRSKMQSVVGTMFYSCPEIIKNEPYNEKADIWALGCILYEMCCFEPPFCTSNMLSLITKITQADYDLERVTRGAARYSQSVCHVIKSCLVIDPNKRVDIVGVASLIADKMLVFADNFRFKCSSLEKKLEKEKNKTQMLYCNKLDLTNSQHRQAHLDLDSGEHGATTSQQVVKTLSAASTDNRDTTGLQSPVHRYPSTPPAADTTTSRQQESLIIDSLGAQQTTAGSKRLVSESAATPTHTSFPLQLNSPNAKLPPKQNPRSKLIMKNIQNKQQLAQSSQQEFASSSVVSFQQQSSFDGGSSNSSQKYGAAAFKNGAVIGSDEATAATDLPTDRVDIVANNGLSSRIQRSSSSSTLEKRPSQSKKPRPNSANSGIVPVYKKLRPVQDPIIQILDQIHKILFIAQLPPSGRKNFKRKLVDRYKRSLFSNKLGSSQIKSELMKLIKNSNELIDIEMIGLKNFQYCFSSSDCNSLTSKKSNGATTSDMGVVGGLDPTGAASASFNALNDFDLIAYQNGITYEQLQTIIEDLLVENHYYTERMKHLREELPSMVD